MELLRDTVLYVAHTVRSLLVALAVGAFVYVTCNAFPPNAMFSADLQTVFSTAQFWIACAATAAAFVVAFREP